MRKYNFILLLSVLFFFCSGSCEEKQGQYFITIQNNSDKEIIFQGSLYSSIAQDSLCFIPDGKYEDFIYDRLIKPYSSRKIKIDGVVNSLQTHSHLNKWSVGIFNRIDFDTMSCDEFEQKFPLKKEWSLTLADMEALDWTLVYP